MDIIELTGLPYPAMPPSARVLLVLAKYAAFGVIPLVIPSIVEDLPIPIAAHPAAARHRLRLRQAPGAASAATSSTSSPARRPATSKAYWGPEIRIGEPQPALTVNMDALTNVERAELQLRQGEEDDADRLLPGAAQQGADRHPDSRHHAAQSAARPGAAAAAEDREPRRHRAAVAAVAR